MPDIQKVIYCPYIATTRVLGGVATKVSFSQPIKHYYSRNASKIPSSGKTVCVYIKLNSRSGGCAAPREEI